MGISSLRAGVALGLALVVCGCQAPRKAPAGPLIVAPSHCTDISFPIYFEPRSSALTQEADRLIAVASDQARGCAVTGIVVVGLADAPGSPDANLELSKRRATAVTTELARRGFTNVEFREGAVGALDASTSAGAHRPLRRRADVSIHLATKP